MARSRQLSGHRIASARELPPCLGPKLDIFQYYDAPIEWLEQLDEDRQDRSEAQGHVFKVKIKSEEYAIKVFKYFDPEETRWYWEPILGESFPRETVAFHTDPFYAECRAYGRIKEAQAKGTLKREILIKCHGYLILKKRDKRILQERGIDLGVSDLSEAQTTKWGDHEVRAIVKDLAPPDPGLNSRNLKRILKDIHWLKKLKIYNRDIRAENFRDGKLVDFGSAVTEPHCILSAFDNISKEEARDTRSEDLVMFDDMIAEEEIKTDVRAMPNAEYCRMLRSNT